MDKNTTQFMDLNRETAMRLWNKQFGKETRVQDFAGREIAKGAYNDRNSDFGWNVDHILPQSKGGKTADHNLICCHILTNDQKASKFPCFVANDRTFEILKVENHYEIHPVKSKTEQKSQQQQNQELNLFDSAAGVRFYKTLKGKQNQHRYVDTVFIRLRCVKNPAVFDFIEEIFFGKHISYAPLDNYVFGNTDSVLITVRDYHSRLIEETNELLNACILLNTYLRYYFQELSIITKYDILFREDYFEKKSEMYHEVHNIKCVSDSYDFGRSSLHINELVREDSEAKEKIERINRSYAYSYDDYAEYDYIYTKLAENLKKEVNGK